MDEPTKQFLGKERRNLKVRNIFDTVRPFSLHEDEKSLVRKNLHAFTLRYPLRNETVHNATYDRVPFVLRLTRMLPTFAAVAIVLLVGAGVSASAENALPGDGLYSVKVSVNEKVRGFFANSLQEKTGWEIELATRRLDEAEQLAARGMLTDEMQTDLARNLDKYSEAFFVHTALLSEKNDELAALALTTRYEATLRAHQNILRGFIGTAQAADPREEALARFVEYIGSEADSAYAHQSISDEELLRSDSTVVAKRVNEIGSVAKTVLEEATLTVKNYEALFNEKISGVVLVNFEEANAAFERGEVAVKRGDYPTAVIEFELSLRSAEAAKILVRLQSNFDTMLAPEK